MRLFASGFILAGGLIALIFGLATLVFAGFGAWSALTHHPRAAMVTLPQYLMLLSAYGLAPCLFGLALQAVGRRMARA